MGQRLVVHVYNKNEEICNIYYHWSAYPMDTVEELKGITDWCIKNKLKSKENKEIILSLIRYCERNGGGVCKEDHLKANDVYKNTENGHRGWFKWHVNRNDGLLAFTKDTMAYSTSISEGDAWVYVDEELVDTDVYYWVFEEYSEFVQYCIDVRDQKEEEIIKEKDIPILKKTKDRCMQYGELDKIISSRGDVFKEKDGFIYIFN